MTGAVRFPFIRLGGLNAVEVWVERKMEAKMTSPHGSSRSAGSGVHRVRTRRVRYTGDPRYGRWKTGTRRRWWGSRGFVWGSSFAGSLRRGLGRWVGRRVEAYGPPFYLMLGLIAAAFFAIGYVAWVVPARARQAAALEELLREKPVDVRLGIVEDRPTLRVLERAQDPPLAGGLPEYSLETPSNFLNTDGARAKSYEHAVPVRIGLMEEEEMVDVRKDR